MDRKKNILLIGGMILCAVILLLTARFFQPAAGPVVLITLNGEEYKSVRLGQIQEIRIDCGNGEYNVLAVEKDGIYMKEANCHDHSCMEQGRVTPENAELRPLGPSIICLPHRVVCTLVGEGEAAPILIGD